MSLLRLPSATQCKFGYENENAGDVDRESFRQGVVEVRNSNCAAGRKGQQAAGKRQQRPIEPRDPFHSAAPRNALRARRALRSEFSPIATNTAPVNPPPP